MKLIKMTWNELLDKVRNSLDKSKKEGRQELAKELSEIIKRSIKEDIIVFNEFHKLKKKLEEELK